MRVLITRPEREAATLAGALAERGHAPVIAPLFSLQMLAAPPDFADALARAQGVLLTSANGARALAEASGLRSKPVFAVGDTTAATAEGLGFSAVASASGDGAALAGLVRQRLRPGEGPLIHVSGVDVAGDLAAELAPDGFDVLRFPLYEAREAAELPESARAALEARALDAITFFSPRAAALFARLTGAAGLADTCRDVTAIAISAAAAEPLKVLPFKAVRVSAKPTRQAVLDEIDRPAGTGVQGQPIMSDTPPPTRAEPATPPAPPPAPAARGVGATGAFVIGVFASILVLAAAVVSLPYWPQEARVLWQGAPPPPPSPPPPIPAPAPTPAPAPSPPSLPPAEVARIANTAVEQARRELNSRLDDLDKRVRAAATTAAQADRPTTSDPAIAELRTKVETLEARPQGNPANDKELAALKADVATLREALQRAGGDEQKALAAARASAVIGIAARLSAALDSGLPFVSDLALLAPLAQGDGKLAEIVAMLQPLAASGVASRAALTADFPSVAKAALADDLADDSFGQRLLGKIKAVVSLRRVGADVAGDSVEARLARAEAALDAGNIAKAAELVKTLPAQTARATATWRARAETHLATQQAVDRLAAHAVSLLGTARPQ